jgi:hypothetical protein
MAYGRSYEQLPEVPDGEIKISDKVTNGGECAG